MSNVEGIDYDPETGDLEYQFWRCTDEDGNYTCNISDCSSCQQAAFYSWFHGDKDIYCVRGGTRSGKSVLGVRGTIIGAASWANTKWLVMAETFSEGKETVFNDLMENLPGENTGIACDGVDHPENSPLIRKYSWDDKHLILENGSKIILGSADYPDRYKGTELAGAQLDEAAQYKNIDLYELIFETLLTRFSSTHGTHSVLITTTGHTKNRLPDIIDKRVDKKGNPLEVGIEDIKLNTTHNPFLSDSYIEQQKNSVEEWLIDGSWGGSEGRVYKAFDREKHTVDIEDIKDRLVSGWRMYGYDSGFGDPRVMLEFGKTTYGQLVVLNEYYKSEKMFKDCLEWVKEKPKGTIYCEWEPEERIKFTKAGFPAINADKSIQSGFDKVKERLEEDADGKVGLLVASHCTETIQEFLTYDMDDVGGSNVDDHAMDSLRYAIATDENMAGDSSWGGVGEDDVDIDIKVKQNGEIKVVNDEDGNDSLTEGVSDSESGGGMEKYTEEDSEPFRL